MGCCVNKVKVDEFDFFECKNCGYNQPVVGMPNELAIVQNCKFCYYNFSRWIRNTKQIDNLTSTLSAPREYRLVKQK